MLANKSRDGVRFCFLVLNPQKAGKLFRAGVGNIKEGMLAKLAEGIPGINQKHISVRLADAWPHYAGVMIDGDVDGPIKFSVLDVVPSGVILRVQPSIPPDREDAVHQAPIYQYELSRPTDTGAAFVRGFRYFWQNAREQVT